MSQAVKLRLLLDASECTAFVAKSEFPFMQNKERRKRVFRGNGCCCGLQGFLVQINTGRNRHLGPFWLYCKLTCILKTFYSATNLLISCMNFLTNSSHSRFEEKQQQKKTTSSRMLDFAVHSYSFHNTDFDSELLRTLLLSDQTQSQTQQWKKKKILLWLDRPHSVIIHW